MGGTGGSPPKYSHRKVKYRKSGGEPPVPPIASLPGITADLFTTGITADIFTTGITAYISRLA